MGTSVYFLQDKGLGLGFAHQPPTSTSSHINTIMNYHLRGQYGV